MLWRVQVEPNNIRRFRFEVGIGARFIALQPVRPEPVPLPHLRHCAVVHTHRASQAQRRPVDERFRWLGLSRQAHNLRLHLRRETITATGAGPVGQREHPAFRIPAVPDRDEVIDTRFLGANRGVR